LSELASALDAIGTTSIHTIGFRHVSAGNDPLSGTGARIHGGPWNPSGSFSTLYLGLSQETVAAEWARAAAAQGLDLDDFLPRELYELDLSLASVLDLRPLEARSAAKLTVHDVSAEEQRACQRVGEAAHSLGLEGLMAPSATGIGDVIAVFLDQLKPNAQLDVVSPHTWNVPADAPLPSDLPE
jgi:RES domain-containing protein